MVFTTFVNFIRSRGPDEFWRKRKIFKLAAHMYGRRRNCYSIAIRAVHKSLQHATLGRKFKKIHMRDLWTRRITAGAEQHGVSFIQFNEGLHKNKIQLNRKVLADLAVWEPATFESLARLGEELDNYGNIKE
ncbi:CLUMA_CG020398, isoform A [Clunio marinus]|uniref:Large ribosomal subunit protein bL20m n=1 Tax=Clunio marinus TaxID=568069 RepID=A0A1J1J6L6_9DIPT|nr:CLUMA_CG020398, isoform A [Clunio marinus]